MLALNKNLSACSFQNIQIMDASCDYLGFGDLSGVEKFGLSQEGTRTDSDQNILGGKGEKRLLRNTSFGCSSKETWGVGVGGGVARGGGSEVGRSGKEVFGGGKKESYGLGNGQADSGNQNNFVDCQNSAITGSVQSLTLGMSEAFRKSELQIDSEQNFSNDEDLKEVSVETESCKQIL